MVKLVDTPDLGSGAARCVGSSPINEYGRTRVGEYVSKGSPEANSVMAKASSEFLQSAGISKKAISEKSRLGDEAVISMAVLEYTKLKNNKTKS